VRTSSKLIDFSAFGRFGAATATRRRADRKERVDEEEHDMASGQVVLRLLLLSPGRFRM
jgi:hypothetical protein